jgi:N-acetyl-gamma-glutamyl-phosphate reductase
MAYKITNHQHIPEIEMAIHSFTNTKQTISFTPHVVPMDRGILSTIYVNLSSTGMTNKTVRDYYNEFYSKSPFVKILPEELLPQTKNVAMTNECHISLKIDKRTGILKIISVIDNLVKGAAGSAIQNFNLMFSVDETTSLT